VGHSLKRQSGKNLICDKTMQQHTGGQGLGLLAKDWVWWPRIGFVGQGLGLLAKEWFYWPRIRCLVAKEWMFGGQGMDVWWPRNGCLVAKDRVLWPRIGFDDQGLG
jgi:hypothetical protein